MTPPFPARPVNEDVNSVNCHHGQYLYSLLLAESKYCANKNQLWNPEDKHKKRNKYQQRADEEDNAKEMPIEPSLSSESSQSQSQSRSHAPGCAGEALHSIHRGYCLGGRGGHIGARRNKSARLEQDEVANYGLACTHMVGFA